MKYRVKKIAKKVVPKLYTELARLRRVVDKLDDISNQLSTISSGYDDRIARLRGLLSTVEHYQPTYHVAGFVETPARSSYDRCVDIEAALGSLPGKRLLDIGSSLGYVSFYFADRGCKVEGWESNIENAEASRIVSSLNGISVDFKTKELNAETVGTINDGDFDAVIILNVFHHIIRFNGIEYAQNLIKELFERVPMMVVELAKKGEDPKLPWDKSQPKNELAIFDLVKDKITIEKIGEYGNHLSSKKRPLYIVRLKKVVSVNSHEYSYDHMQNVAYKNSPVARHEVQRRYYFNNDFVVKEYSLKKGLPKDTFGQILNEIQLLANLEDRNVHHLPKIVDYEISSSSAKVVLKRQEGELLSDIPQISEAKLKRVSLDVKRTLDDLHQLGIHHNDVRPWNIIVNSKGAWLIDFGLAGAIKLEDDQQSLIESVNRKINKDNSDWAAANKPK